MAKEVKARPYSRHYHLAPETYKMLEDLPGWMVMRRHPESNGFQFINATAGLEGERVNNLLESALNNQYPGSANINEPYKVYTTIHDQNQGVMPIPNKVMAFDIDASGGKSWHDLIQVDDVIDLFESPPTRLVPSNFKDALEVSHTSNFKIELSDGLIVRLGTGRWTDWIVPEGIFTVVWYSQSTWRASESANWQENPASAVFNKDLDNWHAAQVNVSLREANKDAGVIVRSTPDAQNCYFLSIQSGEGETAEYIYKAVLYKRVNGTFTTLLSKTFDRYSLASFVTCKLEAKNLDNQNVQLKMYVGTSEDNLDSSWTYVDSSSTKHTEGRSGIMSSSSWSSGQRIEFDDFKILEPVRKGTRYLSGDFLENQKIHALSYFVDYQPSGVLLAREGLIVGLQKDAIIASGYNGVIILASGNSSFEDNLYLHDKFTWGKSTQSFDSKGFDDVPRFNGSGHAELLNIPISGTLKLYDIMNLDSGGNATLISPDAYTATYSASGTIQWNTPSSGTSQYIAEYDYALYTRGRFVTTRDAKWDHQKWTNTGPIFSSTSLPEYKGTKVDFQEVLSTTFPSGRALALDPTEVRPGANVRVNFTYTNYVTGTWNSPETTDLELTIDDPWFKTAHELGVHLYSSNEVAASGLVITRDLYNPTISGSLVKIPSPPLAASGYQWNSLDYKIYYLGEIKYNDSRTPLQFDTVQSISTASGAADPYPDDWILANTFDPETHERRRFIKPMTIVPLTHPSGRILDLMRKAPYTNFEVLVPLDFRGIAYDKDRDSIWSLEQTNRQLYQHSADGGFVSKHNILKPNRNIEPNRKWITLSGVLLPFLPQEPFTEANLTGLVYLQDFLYIIDTTNKVVRRINTFDIFTMDEEYDSSGSGVFEPFPLPTGAIPEDIWDISLNRDNDLLITTPSGYITCQFKYDYWIPDTNQNRIVYREKYDIVDLDLDLETQNVDRGDV